MAQALTFGATILAAVLAYAFGVRQDRRSRLHGERIAATSAFCEAVMDYRGAQIHRWHAERDDAQDIHEAREALRHTRSAVWACYFRVVLVVDHAPASRACRATLDAARQLKYATDPVALDAEGDHVRLLAERFVGEVALKLGIEPASLDVAPPDPS